MSGGTINPRPGSITVSEPRICSILNSSILQFVKVLLISIATKLPTSKLGHIERCSIWYATLSQSYGQGANVRLEPVI